MLTRVIFRQGIELSATSAGWVFTTAPGAVYESLEAAAAVLPSPRPILLQEANSPLLLLVNERTNTPIALERTELLNRPTAGKKLFDIRNLQYHVGAVEYHTQQLALEYVGASVAGARTSTLPGSAIENRMNLSSREECYFEFDACVTAVRRIYDVLRFPLWKYFNSVPRDAPDTLDKVLDRADQLASDFKIFISNSWHNCGETARAYRDSVQHFVPIEFGLSTAELRRLECGAWSTRIRIPDNPQARSRSKFSFTRDLDALDFCLDCLYEIVGLVTRVVNEICTQKE
jgi:hypothetical protein